MAARRSRRSTRRRTTTTISGSIRATRGRGGWAARGVCGHGGPAVSLTGGAAWTSEHNQPTAEFYRVAVDNRYPYHLYGAQQDNSTVSVAAFDDSEGRAPAIQDVGGCESSHLAVDPQHPAIVYGGCYGGSISRTDM